MLYNQAIVGGIRPLLRRPPDKWTMFNWTEVVYTWVDRWILKLSYGDETRTRRTQTHTRTRPLDPWGTAPNHLDAAHGLPASSAAHDVMLQLTM